MYLPPYDPKSPYRATVIRSLDRHAVALVTSQARVRQVNVSTCGQYMGELARALPTLGWGLKGLARGPWSLKEAFQKALNLEIGIPGKCDGNYA